MTTLPVQARARVLAQVLVPPLMYPQTRMSPPTPLSPSAVTMTTTSDRHWRRGHTWNRAPPLTLNPRQGRLLLQRGARVEALGFPNVNEPQFATDLVFRCVLLSTVKGSSTWHTSMRWNADSSNWTKQVKLRGDDVQEVPYTLLRCLW